MESNQNLTAPDQKVLEMLQNALVGAKTAAGYYGSLTEKIKDREDREILRQMMLDELKHEKMLGRIYKTCAGRESICTAEKRTAADSLGEEFKMNIFSETEESESLRILFATFLNLGIRDMLQEIILDKQNHATKFSYLYAKYK